MLNDRMWELPLSSCNKIYQQLKLYYHAHVSLACPGYYWKGKTSIVIIKVTLERPLFELCPVHHNRFAYASSHSSSNLTFSAETYSDLRDLQVSADNALPKNALFWQR